MASWGGAKVIGTVRHTRELANVERQGATPVVALDDSDPVAAIKAYAPDGVDRIIEVGFSDNSDLDAAVAKNGSVIAAYATRNGRPDFPFWPMLFNNITIRLLGSDDFPMASKQQAARDLTVAARDGALAVAIGDVMTLGQIAEAHDRVAAGSQGRILISMF
jgi:NADPH2:quinone reductase